MTRPEEAPTSGDSPHETNEIIGGLGSMSVGSSLAGEFPQAAVPGSDPVEVSASEEGSLQAMLLALGVRAGAQFPVHRFQRKPEQSDS